MNFFMKTYGLPLNLRCLTLWRLMNFLFKCFGYVRNKLYKNWATSYYFWIRDTRENDMVDDDKYNNTNEYEYVKIQW